MQVGYCILLVLATKQETKKALIKAVGFSLVFSNLIMAIWAITWVRFLSVTQKLGTQQGLPSKVMQWFLVSTILQGLLVLFLLYSNVALLVYHPPVSSRPFDTALIHAPLRFFFVLPFMLLFPLNLFITLGFIRDPSVPDTSYDTWHLWPVFGVFLGTNLIGLAVVILRRDIVWTAAATWICISIWSLRPKPAPIYVTAIICTALHPFALFIAELYYTLRKRQPIILDGDSEHPGLYRHQTEQERRRRESEREPREISEDDTWN
ncbi:hypothetical protein Ac2012v2_007720 [Leucoagaricus gongylophorus]